MFVFDARRVLLLPGVCFSDANMQTGAIEGSTEAHFSAIPFDKVYHEGGISGDSSIIRHRCAEVLAPSPMSLGHTLQWIYCRSEAEREMLLDRLGDPATHWEKKIKISDDLRVFEKRFTFVESVSLANDGIIFRLNPRHDWTPIAVDIAAWNEDGLKVVDASHSALPARPPNARAWRQAVDLTRGMYRVEINLDGHLAYSAMLSLDEAPF